MSNDRKNPPELQGGIEAKITSQNVDDAYEAFAALRRLACQEPQLLENAYFVALHDTAYARFLCAFEKL